MLMRAATVVQVVQELLVVAAIILSFKFYCMFYCVFYFTCDRSLTDWLASRGTAKHATLDVA